MMIIEILESGGDTYLAANGTLDVSGLTFDTTASAGADNSFIDFNLTYNAVDNLRVGNYDVYDAGFLSVPTAGSIGTGGLFSSTAPANGSTFQIITLGGNTNLAVPEGYSGGLLSFTQTYAGETLASMSLNPGSYSWTWSTDSIVLNISAIPEPSAYISLAGFTALGFFLLRRRLKAQRQENKEPN